MSKFCPQCGAKLEQDYKFCPECGYDTKKKSGTGSKKQNNVTVQAESGGTVKQIDPVKSIGIFAGIIAFVILVLYLAGTFDSPKMPENTQTGNNTGSGGNFNQGPQVDLNSMAEIQNLEAQVKANPENTQALLQLAHLKNDSGMPEQAIITYRQYLEKNPKDADARVDMGVCYYVLKNYPTAIAEMKEALKYQPRHQIAHLNLGIVNMAAGNLDEAKSWWKKAAEISPATDVGKRAQELLNSH